ncbi:MAG: TIGR03621 family F420-dependent LLM class oxidoreductase [Acidimicrobiia bacterium]|nr:TIGR03621 family F420-dependent LLM class oxidoreductase [Acidimicrobiia bacterium]
MPPTPFRFAVQALDYGNREALIDLAQTAEKLGYDEVFTADHVGMADPIIPLTIAAESTTRLRLGPLVLNNELHHPVLLARTIATADRLTGGRMILGIGTGYLQSEHDATGIELRAPSQRVSRFEESLIIVRSLLTEGSASYSGSYHRVEVDDLGIRPVQDAVPILIGGHGRRVVSVAGRYADIFQFTGLTHGPGGVPAPGGFAIDSVEQRNRWLIEAACDRLPHIERSALIQGTAVGDGAATEMQAAVDRTGLDRTVIEQTPFLLMGSVEQIVDKVERLREDLGISHFVVRDAEGFAPVVDRLA